MLKKWKITIISACLLISYAVSYYTMPAYYFEEITIMIVVFAGIATVYFGLPVLLAKNK